jgi:hypothetical protein
VVVATTKQGWWRRTCSQLKDWWDKPVYMCTIPSAEGRRDSTGVPPTPEEYAQQSAELRAAINSRLKAREET